MEMDPKQKALYAAELVRINNAPIDRSKHDVSFLIYKIASKMRDKARDAFSWDQAIIDKYSVNFPDFWFGLANAYTRSERIDSIALNDLIADEDYYIKWMLCWCVESGLIGSVINLGPMGPSDNPTYPGDELAILGFTDMGGKPDNITKFTLYTDEPGTASSGGMMENEAAVMASINANIPILNRLLYRAVGLYQQMSEDSDRLGKWDLVSLGVMNTTESIAEIVNTSENHFTEWVTSKIESEHPAFVNLDEEVILDSISARKWMNFLPHAEVWYDEDLKKKIEGAGVVNLAYSLYIKNYDVYIPNPLVQFSTLSNKLGIEMPVEEWSIGYYNTVIFPFIERNYPDPDIVIGKDDKYTKNLSSSYISEIESYLNMNNKIDVPVDPLDPNLVTNLRVTRVHKLFEGLTLPLSWASYCYPYTISAYQDVFVESLAEIK